MKKFQGKEAANSSVRAQITSSESDAWEWSGLYARDERVEAKSAILGLVA